MLLTLGKTQHDDGELWGVCVGLLGLALPSLEPSLMLFHGCRCHVRRPWWCGRRRGAPWSQWYFRVLPTHYTWNKTAWLMDHGRTTLNIYYFRRTFFSFPLDNLVTILSQKLHQWKERRMLDLQRFGSFFVLICSDFQFLKSSPFAISRFCSFWESILESSNKVIHYSVLCLHFLFTLLPFFSTKSILQFDHEVPILPTRADGSMALDKNNHPSLFRPSRTTNDCPALFFLQHDSTTSRRV